VSRRANSVRIEAGSLRGRALEVPSGARPTAARVRGALFSIWSDRLAGARFLDLYAGSGAVGLEAISRGALEAGFIESSRPALAALERNLRLAPSGSVRLIAGALPGALDRLFEAKEKFELVFADPPYARPPAPALFETMARIARPETALAVEHDRRSELPAEIGAWIRTGLRKYGETALSFYARTP